MTEEQKAADRAKPVSSTPVPGTPWCIYIYIIFAILSQLVPTGTQNPHNTTVFWHSA